MLPITKWVVVVVALRNIYYFYVYSAPVHAARASDSELEAPRP